MSLTSYRAAPLRVKKVKLFLLYFTDETGEFFVKISNGLVRLVYYVESILSPGWMLSKIYIHKQLAGFYSRISFENIRTDFYG